MATSASKSKTEYLKRYLEGENKAKRKKSKSSKSSVLVPRLKIVDKNIDVKSIKFGDEVEEMDDEEAPVIAEVIDDRPDEIKLKEVYAASHWKKLDSASDEDYSKSATSSLNRKSCALKNVNKPSRTRMDSDSDCSPPRHSSSKHANKPNSGSDTSPPRQKNTNKSSKSVRRHDSDSDISPPRHKNTNRNSKTVKGHNSGSDISPPRRNSSHKVLKTAKRYDSDSDFSPPRNNSSRHSSKSHRFKNSKASVNADSDLSPERKRKGQGHSSRRQDSDSDLSPPRKHLERDDKLRPTKTLSGLKAGLQNAKTLRNETHELRHREKNQIEQMGAELSGRDAQTIVRDRKTGKRRDLEEEDKEKEEEKRRLSEQQKKYSEWGKGIEQTENRKNKLSEDLYEMTKPMARHQGDDDLEEMLKSRIHDDDPMAEYMLKKKKKDDVSKMPEYNGPPPPPNRFGLRPGYRWDGVDRSNGFEKKYFEKVNATKAGQEEAYLWSVQDM